MEKWWGVAMGSAKGGIRILYAGNSAKGPSPMGRGKSQTLLESGRWPLFFSCFSLPFLRSTDGPLD